MANEQLPSVDQFVQGLIQENRRYAYYEFMRQSQPSDDEILQFERERDEIEKQWQAIKDNIANMFAEFQKWTPECWRDDETILPPE